MKSQESGNESAESVNAEQNLGVPGSRLRPTPALDADRAAIDRAIGNYILRHVNHVYIWLTANAIFVTDIHAADIQQVTQSIIERAREMAQRESGSVSTTEGATVPSQPSPDSESQHCPICDSGLVVSDEEAQVVADLSQRLELRPAAVWKQALRVYQLHVLGEPELSKLPTDPVSESLTPDVQGKLVERRPLVFDTENIRWDKSAYVQGKLREALQSMLDLNRDSTGQAVLQIKKLAREALALLDGQR